MKSTLNVEFLETGTLPDCAWKNNSVQSEGPRVYKGAHSRVITQIADETFPVRARSKREDSGQVSN
jgi:hypothetical protein